MKHKEQTKSIILELHRLISLKDTLDKSEYEKRLKILLNKVDSRSLKTI